ncbi:MAG: hypothetical protein AAF650_10310 [Pseudomonadota bacterium]
MINALLSILVLGLLVALSTLASVLLARFYLAHLNADARVVMAGFGGPIWILLPFLIYMLATEGLRDAVTLVTLSLMGIGFMVVGWPISLLATRKLDRLITYDPKIFD